MTAADPNVLRQQISDRLDRWDEEHETSGCPARAGECIHSAAAAVRMVLPGLTPVQVALVAKTIGIEVQR